MCASYNPPSESITQFNSALFNQIEDTLSQSEADTLYLSKKKNDTSTAPLTTFTGAVNSYGDLTVGVRGVSGGIFNVYRRQRIWDINNASQTYGDLYSTGTGMEYTVLNQGSPIQTYHRFYTCPSSSSSNNLSMDIGNAETTIYNRLVSGVSGGLDAIFKTAIRLIDVVSPYTNIAQIYLTGSGVTYKVNAGPTTATSHNFFTYNSSNVETTPLSISSSTCRVSNRIDVGTDGGNQTSYFRTAVQMMDMNSPYNNYNQILTSGPMALYNMYGNMTQHRFATYNAVPAQVVSLDIYSNQIVSRVPLTIKDGQISGPETQIVQSGNDFFINNAQPSGTTYLQFNNTTSVEMNSSSNISRVPIILKQGQLSPQSQIFQAGNDFKIDVGQTTGSVYINFNNSTATQLTATQFTMYVPIRHNKPTYTFPFTLAQHQGYYLKTTGTAQSVVTATPKTILTTPSIAIGVWRIDFSVINTVTSGGNITQSQNFISNTNNGAVATAIDFTGSVLRSHTTENYATGDIQEVAGSFTYNQSTAGVLYLNILRTFSTGVYSFVGEVAITRIA